MGILGYSDVTSAHIMTLLGVVMKLSMSRIILRELVQKTLTSLSVGCSSLSKYIEVWYVIEFIDEIIGLCAKYT